MKVDFEKHLQKGERSYDTKVGDWWVKKSEDRAHIKAYKNIAEFIAGSFAYKPRFIIDYACGPGAVLQKLAPMMPDTKFVALDGSRKMLRIAHEFLSKAGLNAKFVTEKEAFQAGGPQIRLLNSNLPWDEAPAAVADGAMLIFPNLNATTKQQKLAEKNWILEKGIIPAARLFSHIREIDAKKHDPDQVFEELILERAISENIRHLLKPDSLWFKVDYANARREDLEEIDHWKMLFSEAALEIQIGSRASSAGFKLKENHYFRSGVILDVYDQTKDPADKTGGYIISVFEKLRK